MPTTGPYPEADDSSRTSHPVPLSSVLIFTNARLGQRESFQLYRRVVQKKPDVSKQHIASIFRFNEEAKRQTGGKQPYLKEENPYSVLQ
jgi:hypothetical protein